MLHFSDAANIIKYYGGLLPKEASDASMYHLYSANMEMNNYGAADQGYISREQYYEEHAFSFFSAADENADGLVDFEELRASIINEHKIELLTSDGALAVMDEYMMKPMMNRSESEEPRECTSSFSDFCALSPLNASDGARRRLGGDCGSDGFGDYDYGRNHSSDEDTLCYDDHVCYKDTDGDCHFDSYVIAPPGYNRLVCPFWLESFSATEGCHELLLYGWTGDCIYFHLLHGVPCYMATYWCWPRGYDECWDSCECQQLSSYHDRRRLSGWGCLCFGGDNEVEVLRDNQLNQEPQRVPMRALKVGDSVRSKDGEWTKVFFIKHEFGEIHHLKIYFGDNQYLTVTPIHLLYVDVLDDAHLVPAREVEVGSVLFVMDAERNELVERKVVFIGNVMEKETFAPITMSGSLAVNNVLASSYGGSTAKRHQQYHGATTIFRWISEEISEDIAAKITAFNYYLFFQALDRCHLQFVVYNLYSGPIVVALPLFVPFLALLSWRKHRRSDT